MKADSCGTYTEQIRARMGWKPLKQLRAEGLPTERNCANCKSHWFKEFNRGDGGFGISLYCGHPKAGGKAGHATRDSAVCNEWEAVPPASNRRK